MSKIGKRTVAGLLLLAAGCVAQDPRFFSCHRWVDRNQNRRIEKNEFEGRNSFLYRSSDDVTFVAWIKQPPGTPIGWKLRSPDGIVLAEGDGVQKEENTVYRRGYIARDLIRTRGTGLWRVDWFVNGTLVGSSSANIVR